MFFLVPSVFENICIVVLTRVSDESFPFISVFFRFTSLFTKMIDSTADTDEMIELFCENYNVTLFLCDSISYMLTSPWIGRMYLLELVRKFRRTRTVLNNKKELMTQIWIEKSEWIQVAVLGHMSVDPTSCSRQFSWVSKIRLTSCQFSKFIC